MTELEFLRCSLPQSDWDCYGEAFLQQFAEHGQMLRRAVPWCKGLDPELFDHYVLCPRINDEELSFYCKVFFDALWERLVPLETMEQRILEVNRWCGRQANYQMQDDRTASALTVYRNGSGRCGEESVFLVAALRSVGIPARQVYVPRWAHCDDNHAWVEAWCDGRWRFLGACEPEPVLDRGWFNTPASRALLVHSRIFGASDFPVHGQLLCRDGCVSWYNQTGRYARTKVYRFSVSHGGVPAAGAKIHIQVLNEASLHTVATLTADQQGRARIEMGMGDFHILAVWEHLWAETVCAGEETVLHLRSVEWEERPWCGYDIKAPSGSDINESILAEAQKHQRTADREVCGQCRTGREALFDSFAKENPQWEDLILLARGNGRTIARFLEQDGDPKREALLRTLTAKDLRDVTMEVLNDHLYNTPERGEIPEEIYIRYVLCPRIDLEVLRPWRRELSQLKLPQDPIITWAQLCRRVRVHEQDSKLNLCRTPLESWQKGRCSEKDFGLLFVALLRCFGVPARLRKLDGMPEYWNQGQFVPIYPEQKGILRLNGAEPFVYKQDYTLSVWIGDEWKLLCLPHGNCEIQLPADRLYRLITTRRMPNGNQYAAMRDIVIRPGETVSTELYFRPYALADMLGSQQIPPMAGYTPDGRKEDLLTGRPGLLLWLEAGVEPTEHLMAELAQLHTLPLDVTVLLRNWESLQNTMLRNLLRTLPDARVLLDDWDYDLETVARYLTCDPDTPPLAVVCDENGNAVFGASGYRVGLGKLLSDIAAYLCS